MFSAEAALLSFLLGIVGAIIGGTQTFIMTGVAGLFFYALQAAGVSSPFISETLLNTVFLPAIIFNSATVASAVAAKRGYDIKGYDVTHSLLFTHDPWVMLLAGLGGLAGYLVFTFARVIGMPADQGSFSVITIGVLTRLLLGNGHWKNHNATAYYREQGVRYWVFQLINAVGVCGVMAIVLSKVPPEFYNVGFSISAAMLLLHSYDREGKTYPTTHHETLVVGYAMAATGGNVLLSIVFGMIANLIFLLFARYFNEDCDTHIDPPAVAIFACSLVLFTLF
jgi:hypothetical protein